MITFMSSTIQTGIGGVDHAHVQDGGPTKLVKIIIDNSKLFTYKTSVKCRNIWLDLFRSHILINYINFITEIFGDGKWRSGPTRLPLEGFDGDVTRYPFF